MALHFRFSYLFFVLFRNFVVLLFLIASIKTYSQQTVQGIVTDASRKPISDASVSLYAEQDSLSIKSYTITNAKGEFRLTLPDGKNYFFETSLIGYKPKKTKIKPNVANYSVQLEEKFVQLQEVVVTAPVLKDVINLKRDTVKFAQGASLKDILKDNEGIEITDGDAIKYMGVPINKILINKKEVFVNQNSLAINNLTNEMIENIQVINNHKDRFNVDFDNFEETVINVDVKKKFRGALKTELNLLGGHKNAFNVSAKSMFFSDKINAFLTQNTNNVNQRKVNQSEINRRHQLPSTFYGKHLNQITNGANYVKKDLSNSTYLLLKKESEMLKSSLNIGYLLGKQRLENITEIGKESQLLSIENSSTNQRGNLVYADFSQIYLFSSDFSLSVDSKIDFLHNKIGWQTNKNILPDNYFSNKVDTKNNSFLIKNILSTRKIINSKWLLNTEFSHHLENTVYHFANTDLVTQETQFNNNRFSASSDLSYQYSNLFNLGTKIKYTGYEEKISDVYKNTKILNRDYGHNEWAMIARGHTKKMYYFLKAGADTYFLKDKTEWTFPVSASFNYRFNNSRTLYFSYEKTWNVEPVEHSVDSFYSNNNTLVINSIPNNNLTKNQTGLLEYNVSNMSKSKTILFMASGSIKNNFTQLSLKDFTNNVVTYERLLFDSQRLINFRHRYSKGYYFSPKYHQVKLGYNLGFNLSKGDLLYDNRYSELINRGGNIALYLSFTFQDLFLSNLSFSNNYSINNSIIGGDRINQLKSNTTKISLDKNSDQYDFSLEAYRQEFSIDSRTVNRYDLNLTAKYKINQNLLLQISGQSLFSLFRITDNYANVSTSSTTGYNVTTINDNILGYAMVGLNYKF